MQDRFVYLPEMPYRKVDLDKTRRTVVSAAEFAAAGGQGTPATWLHTVTFDNLHPQTIAAIRVNGLTGKASDYKLYAKAPTATHALRRCRWKMPPVVSARRRCTRSASPCRTAATLT